MALSGVDSAPPSPSRRAGELSKKLAEGLKVSPDQVYELCRDLDEAVEFAALEGVTTSEAVVSFMEEGWALGWPPTYAELAKLTNYGSPGLDASALKLPVMPKQASRLLRTSADDISPAEIETLTASDPVLAGKLLGAANSAMFGSKFEIVRLRDAIMRLGIPEVRKILLAACFGGLFASKPLQDLWNHSQDVAAAACELAPLAGIESEMAYLAGLLHDIGRLGFAKALAPLRIREQEWIAAGFPVAYAETLAYGLDHAVLGAQLLGAWELPSGIIEAVGFHHRPERSKSALASLLNLAEDVTSRAESEDLWPEMRRFAACTLLKIDPAQLQRFRSGADSQRRACA